MTFLALVCLVIWLALLGGRSWFWLFRAPPGHPPRAEAPDVVVVVPARNEAVHIADCVSSLFEQDYAGSLRVIVVDDGSDDDTAGIAARAALAHNAADRLQVVRARPLPQGWSGKVWAQAEGIAALEAGQQAGRALPRYLWFTDADIVHRPQVLSGLVADAEAEQLVLNSHMVHLRCVSRAERALIPAFVFFFGMLYPFEAVNRPHSKTAAAAGGSMLVRRDSLAAIGGIEVIAAALIDDCALAAKLKTQGPIRIALGHASFSMRPYPQFEDVWTMVARTAYTQLRYSPLLLTATVLGLALTYLVPVALAIFSHGAPAVLGRLTWMLMALAFVPIALAYRRSLLWGFALPAIAAFYLSATVGSAWLHWQGRGGQWKSRHNTALASGASDQSR